MWFFVEGEEGVGVRLRFGGVRLVSDICSLEVGELVVYIYFLFIGFSFLF